MKIEDGDDDRVLIIIWVVKRGTISTVKISPFVVLVLESSIRPLIFLWMLTCFRSELHRFKWKLIRTKK